MDKQMILERSVSLAVAKHDDNFVYELPYRRGREFRVLQGYGGSYSHTDTSYYSLDFEMPKDTPVCSARFRRGLRGYQHLLRWGEGSDLQKQRQ